jgi:hypothetical protein
MSESTEQNGKAKVADLPVRKVEPDRAKQVKGGGIKLPDVRGQHAPIQPCI